MRQLVSKDTIWHFSENHQEQYDKLKALVSSNTLLKYYNPDLTTKLTCDSSKHGLGATLEQFSDGQWHPIASKSRTCTSTEQNYCPLERETLAVVFACAKFHEYIYGRHFFVESDHKSLKNIFKTPIHKAPPRILDECRVETSKNKSLQALRKVIETGWPDSKMSLPDCIKPFFNVRDHLTIVENLILKDNRIVIPSSMRPEYQTYLTPWSSWH